MEFLRKNAEWYLLGILFLANILSWYAVFQYEKNVLSVAFLDIGQDDAILTVWTQYTHSYSV
jgi:hypothetical protein